MKFKRRQLGTTQVDNEAEDKIFTRLRGENENIFPITVKEIKIVLNNIV